MLKKLALLGGAAAVLAACPAVVFEPPAEWEAMAEPVEPEPIAAGALRAAVGFGTTEAAISIAGGEAGQSHGWELRHGDCGTRGDLVGRAADYPALPADGAGRATATATIQEELAVGQIYHVNVLTRPGSADVMACGRLRPR